MRLFFDNNISEALADSLGGFVRHEGHTSHHISTLPCGRHARDVEWFAMLATEHDWVVFTGDLRISRNKGEREAYRKAGLLGFVLSPGLRRLPQNQIAATLLLRWPDIERLFQLVDTGLYEIPVGKPGGRFKSLL